MFSNYNIANFEKCKWRIKSFNSCFDFLFLPWKIFIPYFVAIFCLLCNRFGATIVFLGIRQVCPFPRFSMLHRCESPVKSTNQVGRFYHMTFQNAPRWSPGTKLKCHIAAIGEKIARCVRINRRPKSLAIFTVESNWPRSAYEIARCVAGFRLLTLLNIYNKIPDSE